MKQSKRAKKLYILVGVLAVVCLVTFIVKRTEEKKEQIKNTDQVILDIDPETVTSLSWSYDDTSLSYHKDETWQWDDDSEFPVDEEKINELLSVFREFGASFVIDDVEDLSQYGLDDPTCTINFSTEDADYEVLLGDFSQMDSQRYVSIGDGKVYLVSTDPFDSYEITVEKTIKNDEIPDFDKATQITFSGEVNSTLTYAEDSTDTYCADDRYFTTVDGKNCPVDTALVEQYCEDMREAYLETYVSYKATEEELAAWGLDDPELMVTVDYIMTDEDDQEQEGSVTLNIGQNQEELAAKQEAEEKDEEYSGTVTTYARIGESDIVYELTESDYTALIAASYNDLRHKEVFSGDLKKVSQIDVTLDGESYTIASETSDDVTTYSYNGEALEDTDLGTCIEDLSVEEFTDAAADGKEELSLTFHQDDENYPEVTVNLYRYDGSYCLAVLDGQSLGLVNRSDVVDLIESINTIVLG